jgi:hypothetical protein
LGVVALLWPTAIEAASGVTTIRVTGELSGLDTPLFAMRGEWLAFGAGVGAAF